MGKDERSNLLPSGQSRELQMTHLDALKLKRKVVSKDIPQLEKNESSMDSAIEDWAIDDIFEKVTPYGLANCKTNSLTKSLEVSYKLKRLAKLKAGPNQDELVNLSSSLEDFAWTLVDFSKSKAEPRKILGDNFDLILETSLDNHKKKFLSHPVVYSFLSKKWLGDYFDMEKESIMRGSWSLEWLKWKFLLLCMVFDFILFPIVFPLLYLIKFCKPVPFEFYNTLFQLPFSIFFRDMMSYLMLLFLHFAVCVQTTGPRLSVLEWIIMVFFIGRLCMEVHQLIFTCKKMCSKKEKSTFINLCSMHFRDNWNLLDLITILIYVVLLTIRFITWYQHDMGYDMYNNRMVSVGAYLYSLNVVFLTFRTLGQLFTMFQSSGVMQIALLKILKILLVIVGQFVATVLAFSFAIHKVYNAGVAFAVSSNSTSLNKTTGICDTEEGIACWWSYTQHLIWSLIGAGGGVDGMDSPDQVSYVIGIILYVLFLIIGVVLLMNMLIALLTNTYQKVEDNAFFEWSYRRASTIQTYSMYHPVPVPFNIISLIILPFYYYCKEKGASEKQEYSKEFLAVINDLESDYFDKHGYYFLKTESDKIDEIIKETTGNRQLNEHIAGNVFKSYAPVTNTVEWKCKAVSVDGQRLSYVEDCDCSVCSSSDEKNCYHVARYHLPLSKERPGFEVLITESGVMRCLAIGIMQENQDHHKMPGWSEGTVGYHIDDGKTFDKDTRPAGKEWLGAMAFRGDLIGCEVLFDEVKGSVFPVQFTRNGAIIGDKVYLDCKPNSSFYPCVGMGEKGINVLFRMRDKCPCDSTSRQLSKLSEQVSSLTEQLKLLLKTHRITLPATGTLVKRVVINISGNDPKVNEKLPALKTLLQDIKLLKLSDKLSGDGKDSIIMISNRMFKSHMCWTADRDGKMIVPPMSLGHEQIFADNLNHLLRYEAALQLVKSSSQQREVLHDVDVKVSKVENMEGTRGLMQRVKQIEESLKRGIDLTGQDPEHPTLLRSHLVDMTTKKLKDGSGDGFVFKVSNKNHQPVFVTVLLFQCNGAINIIHPSNQKDFDGNDHKLDFDQFIADIQQVFIPSNSLRRMVEPDLLLDMPSKGTDVLVVYASTEPINLAPLAQTQIKLDSNLVTEEIPASEHSLSDYQDFIRTLDALRGMHSPKGFSWMVKKYQIHAVI